MRFSVVRDSEPHAVVDGTNDTATITTYPPGSTTAIETATAMTITTGASVITVALDTSADTTNYTIRTGYRGVVTYTENATGDVYYGEIFFDVCREPLFLVVTYDQLLDLDGRLRGMDHAGDDDLSPIIEACRDEYQLQLESIADETGMLTEDMYVDPKVNVAFRRYILAEFFAGKGEEYKGAKEHHEKRYKALWELYLRQAKPDRNQDGSETDTPMRRVKMRLYT